VAAAGISIEGGDRKTLARGEHAVENCDIHHYARRQKTYKPAVHLGGVGNRVSHCLIHDAPHQGIAYAGNDHIIEYCDFTRIARRPGTSAPRTRWGIGPSWGTSSDITTFTTSMAGNLGCFTIYPDLPCGGIHLHGNVFYDVDQVFHANSGRGMVIENNIFFRCSRGFSFLPWSDASMFQEGGAWRMVENLKAVNYDQPPYSTRYPVLQHLAEDFSKGVGQLVERELPKDNIIRRNVSWGSLFLHVFPPGNLEHVKVETNLIADDIVFEGSFDGRGKSESYHNGDPAVVAEFARRGNILVQGDPGFGDLQTQDFRFSPRSPASGFSFERIPFEQMGLVKDDYRRALPPTVYSPTIIPGATNLAGAQTAGSSPRLRCMDGDVWCVYTVDGSDPTLQSPVYVRPLTIANTVTLKAVAFVADKPRAWKSETAVATIRAR